MNHHDESMAVALTSAEVAWPIVLAMCIALMVAPFLFLIFGRGESESDDAPG